MGIEQTTPETGVATVSDEVSRRLAALAAALAAGWRVRDLDALRAAAHRLKCAGGSVGARAVESVAARLESRALAASADAACADLGALAQDVDAMIELCRSPR